MRSTSADTASNVRAIASGAHCRQWAPEAIDQGRWDVLDSAPCSQGRRSLASVAAAGAWRWLCPGRGHQPARVHRPAGGGVPRVGAAVAGEENNVVEVADVPAREVHRLEGRALTAVAGPRAEGRVRGEQRTAVVGQQVELEILVPQVAAGLVDRLERDAVRVGQA